MLVHTPPCQGDILYYYYSKKKSAENDVTSRYHVTYGHVTNVTSGHVTSDVISGDITSGRKKNRFCDENEKIFRKTTGKWYAENDVMYAENK